jgi:hypothetical protein
LASKKNWFFNIYQGVLRKMDDKEDLNLLDVTQFIGENLLEHAKALAPAAPIERAYTSVFDGRVIREAETSSQRRGVASMEDSWRLKIREKGDGDAVILLSNVAPHAKWVVYGTEGHRIPLTGDAKPLLFFFWERRLGDSGRRWGPTPGHEPEPSWRKLKWAEHPGALPNPFLQRAKKDIVPLGRANITEIIKKWLTRIHLSSGFREGRP